MSADTIDYASLKGLPVSKYYIDEIIERNLYYVDKTPYIKKFFLQSDADVVLITRPRRFGKSLMMDTFYKFLMINPETSGDTSFQDRIFKDTEIYKDKDFCQKFMGKYPVISISLKDVDASNFAQARGLIATEIFKIANSLGYLLKSPIFSEAEISDFKKLMDRNNLASDEFESNLKASLKTISNMLYRYYGKQVIILIDEYDVPLAKAYDGGYYSDMVKIIRGMLSTSLKGNPALFKGILTGCLRVSKESIFTGFNNVKVNSVSNDRGHFAQCMGFTKDEVRTMLSYYGLSEFEQDVKDWYDGYRIWKSEIFCPWDVINYCSDAKADLEAGNDVLAPQSYWSATGTNNVIQQFMPYLDESEAERMQTLLDGGQIHFRLNELLNYNDIGNSHSADNFWTLLLYTGYLTLVKPEAPENQRAVCTARIPNKEIKEAFKNCIYEYYDSEPVKTESSKLLDSFFKGDKKQIRTIIEGKLKNFVALRDLQTKAKHENFYHGFLNGLFSVLPSTAFTDFSSNTDTGDGYADITFSSLDHSIGIVIEIKTTSDKTKLAQLAGSALDQIRQKNYIETFVDDDDVEKVYCYGIAFCQRNCKVQCEIKNM